MIVPYEPEHLTRLNLQRAQAIMQPMLVDPIYAQSLKDAGCAYSLVIGDEVHACMGLVKQWDERAIAWGLIGEDSGKHFPKIHRAVLATMEMHPFRRVETSVTCNFPNGRRWAGLLGFVLEGTMKAFTPDGRDCDLYAKVRAT